MSNGQTASQEGLVRFWDLVPGIFSMISRLPTVVKSIKGALDIQDEDYKSLGLMLEENARLHPDKTAILYEDVKLSHKAFNEAINRHAHYFLSLGIKQGDPVIVFIENRPELLIVASGLAKIGAISSFINTNQRDRVLAHSINLTKGRFFVIGEELVEAFEAVKGDYRHRPRHQERTGKTWSHVCHRHGTRAGHCLLSGERP